MLGKIVMLKGIPLEDGFKVYEGVEFKEGKFCEFAFAELTLLELPKKSYQPTYCWGIEQKESTDGHNKFLVNNLGLSDNKPEKDFAEDRIWVIIPHAAAINTTAKKIAGRNPCYGIFEMKRGDFIKVKKAGAKAELYMAVNAGNEMFLIKRTR